MAHCIFSEESPTVEKVHTLAVCFKYGAIYLMNNYDDVCPRVVHTMLTGTVVLHSST